LLKLALSLNPEPPDWYWFPFFVWHFERGEFDAALDMALRARNERFFWTHGMHALAFAALGMRTEAAAAVTRLLELYPGFPAWRARSWRAGAAPSAPSACSGCCARRAADPDHGVDDRDAPPGPARRLGPFRAPGRENSRRTSMAWRSERWSTLDMIETREPSHETRGPAARTLLLLAVVILGEVAAVPRARADDRADFPAHWWTPVPREGAPNGKSCRRRPDQGR
jgi:hypothetical protein